MADNPCRCEPPHANEKPAAREDAAVQRHDKIGANLRIACAAIDP
jgi:hypothetical protein